MQIKVDPGGEKYVSIAKKWLRDLENTRKDLRLPVLQKKYPIDAATLVQLVSSDAGDRIRISAAPGVVFTLRPYITRVSDGYTVGPSGIFSVPPGKTKFSPYTAATDVGIQPRLSALSGTLITKSGVDAYLSLGGKDTLIGSTFFPPAVSMAQTPFELAFTTAGVEQKHTLLYQPYVRNPAIRVVSALSPGVSYSGSWPAYTYSGPAVESLYDVSPDGRTLIGVDPSFPSDIYVVSLDGAARTAVRTVESAPDVGEDHVVENYDGDPTYVDWYYDSTSFRDDVSAHGFSATNARQTVSVSESRTYSSYTHKDFIDTGPLGLYGQNGTHDTNMTSAFSVNIPGVAPIVEEGSTWAYTASGYHTLETDSGGALIGGTQDGGGTASASRTDCTIEILYVDASLPAVIYRHTKKVYDVGAVVDGFFDSLSTLVFGAGTTMTRTTTVKAVIGALPPVIVQSLVEENITSDLDGVEDPLLALYPVGGDAVLAGTPGGGSAFSGASDVINPLTADGRYVVPAKQQTLSVTFTHDNKGKYLGQYIDDAGEAHVFGSAEQIESLFRTAVADFYIAELLAIQADPESGGLEPEQVEILADLQAGNLSGYTIGTSELSVIGVKPAMAAPAQGTPV